MSFGVAVQSAIFYVVSCAPCLQARHHQQSKALAKKEREIKARIQAENPGSYRHPDPFNTNPYWSEEIMMGPSLQSKKYAGGNKNNSQKRLNSSGKESASVAESTTQVDSMSPVSSHTAVAEDGKLSFSTTLSDDWNRKRYQREDEELWGHELSRTGHKLMDAIKHAGSSAGRLLETRLGMEPKPVTEEDRHNFYFAPRNPPVNEYHPPIVCQKPTHRTANMWMLQPPPPAKVMEGKVPVSRSGSMASHLSRKTTAASESASLSRLVHERTVEAKLKSGELPTDFESTSTLQKTVSRKNTSSRRQRSRRSTRSRSLSIESTDTSDEATPRRKHRVRPIAIVDSSESSSSDDEEFFLRSSNSFGRGKRAARRPTLRSIPSTQENEKNSKENVSTKTKGDQKLTRSASSALATVTSASQLNRVSSTSKPSERTVQKDTPEKPSSMALGPPLEAAS
ncbi:uncharacterized protein F4812DRAFT_400633 [Daldinia caldariorum]|uniref:uncharacterized protein n=1 Tax=Daldinia caldariorum TaxID=326644 RepID=UPI002007D8CA|nr:uncharacterized protein F4812DRAFT_400633 [Daldinia caldariorum]KAI1467540.1 hypothetical protein F4812DRAFT_400633 [Daldinia caldariorum]